jgi:hypothetical protein
MNENIIINRFDIAYKNINQREIEHIEKYLYNYLYIYNEDFNDDLNNLPLNIKILGFYSKNCNLQHLPSHIKWLNLFDLQNHYVIPNHIDILYIGHRYLHKFPDVLATISYGLKVLMIEIITNDITEINLDYLPDSIEKIILTFDYCNIKLNLNKICKNLKCIYINELKNINNIEEIEEYTENNNVELIENYMPYETIFNEYISNN